MLKRFHPTPSGVIATIALVLAMSGGAYAAKKYLITSTKQISPSVLKSLKGASGKAGLAGPAGPAGSGSAGPAGPAGSVGPAGADGKEGAAGKEGPPGKDGKNGKDGKDGNPWTAGGTLPVGSTETGVWSMGEVPAGATPGTLPIVLLKTAISFSIPLAAPLGESAVHVFEGATIPSGCSGKVVEEHVVELKATSGNLCVWVSRHKGVTAEGIAAANTEEGEVGAGRSGATLNTSGLAEESLAEGTWAVTG